GCCWWNSSIQLLYSGSGMLEPVSTSTVFSWPPASVARKIAHPRKTAKNLYRLVRTRRLHLAEVVIKFREQRTNNFTAYTTRLTEGIKSRKGSESTVVLNSPLKAA